MQKFTAVSMLALAAAIFCPGQAQANDKYLNAVGFYGTVNAGYSSLLESDVTPATGATAVNKGDNGYNFGVGVGYKWNRYLRTELAGNYANTDVGNTPAASGDVTAWSGMLNNYVYVPAEGMYVRPYFGVGIGAVGVKLDANGVNGVTGSVDDNDVQVAYQGIVGMELPVAEKAALGLEYRYFQANDLSLRTGGGAAFDYEYASHAINLRLNVDF